MSNPPGGKQPRNRLPKQENEAVINETIRRIRDRLPGWLGHALAIVVGGGGGGTGLPQRLLTDEGFPMVDDAGNPLYVG